MTSSIGDRRTFEALRRAGHRASAGPLTVIGLADGSPVPRVSYAVGRSVGTAVVRNRVRRQLRAVVAGLERDGQLPPGAYLVVVRPEATEIGHDRLEADLRRALGRWERSEEDRRARKGTET